MKMIRLFIAKSFFFTIAFCIRMFVVSGTAMCVYNWNLAERFGTDTLPYSNFVALFLFLAVFFYVPVLRIQHLEAHVCPHLNEHSDKHTKDDEKENEESVHTSFSIAFMTAFFFLAEMLFYFFIVLIALAIKHL